MRLDDVPIEAPCDEDWDRMRPAAGGCRRYCDHCAENVHDLSAMSEREARSFLAATEHLDVCVAYTHDERGDIEFQASAEIVPLARLRRRRPPAVAEAAKLASAASFAALLSACTPHDRGEAVPVVSDPVEHGARPMVVIPRGPADAEHAKPSEVEPCEPSEATTPRPSTKKGKRKRLGRRAPRSELLEAKSHMDLGGL